MGVDGVELLMAVEEEFKIVITEQEAMNVKTPGDLCDIVYRKLRHSANEVCPSQHGFYLARKSLIKYLGVERKVIKPSTKISEIFQRKKRRELWGKILLDISGGDDIWAPLENPKT